MSQALRVSIGQCSDPGPKEINQDFHGALIPDAALLRSKGIAIAIADGIGSSSVSDIASESAIKSFLADYYCTSETWSVKTAAQRVISATNSWLHAQTRRGQYPHDPDRGYVCTLSVMVVKSTTAHILHIGDSRVCRVVGGSLEQLTDDHRVRVSSQQVYLGRALGMNASVEIDYRAVPLNVGDLFILTTDGVHDHVDSSSVINAITHNADDLDRAARAIVAEAGRRGSPDNLTIQIVRIDSLPDSAAAEVIDQADELSPPPLLEARQHLDGYEIIRSLHASSRGHVYLAVDTETRTRVAIKIPSIDLRGDPAYLRRFMMEEWAARRIDSAHVLRACPSPRRRSYLYTVMEYVEGQTLAQWMTDNPRPDLETVRNIIEQIVRGVRAFHRREMLHQDLRPENIMIDRTGTVRIIDLGAIRIAGVAEGAPTVIAEAPPGTFQYMAPEYLLGETGTERSDQYSLGVIAYRLLTGRLPYGDRMARTRKRQQQRRVAYDPAGKADRDIPAWVDGALRKAVDPDPARRYEDLSEFVQDLRHPNPAFARTGATPLIERNPVRFWQIVCALLVCVIILLVAR